MPERNVFSCTEVPCGKTFASSKDLVFPIAVNKGFRHLSKHASALNAHIESKIPSCQRSFSTCLEDHVPHILSSGSTVLHCACLHAGTTKVCCLFMHASGGLSQNFPMSEEIDNGATSKNKKRRVDAVNQAWKIFATDYEEGPALEIIFPCLFSVLFDAASRTCTRIRPPSSSKPSDKTPVRREERQR
ncbi:hypothetical protein SELMODRAFT_404637 [Selaginella moellendorffii]|uniref:Uncharacterized protein n=1 Tax=Selaginella moellendorffii TaxID=88036 RepID=D8QVY3_SELML|nr:hypothetical protein SELMODRAFT_404637 [Selaginella moellendorffii]